MDKLTTITTIAKRKTHLKFLKEVKEKRKKRKEKKLLTELDNKNPNDLHKDHSGKPISTISIAVPGSILENAQSTELRTYLAGQVARAACIYNVDEIVVFDDYSGSSSSGSFKNKISKLETDDGQAATIRHSCVQMARILQYLECPQYLRKFFFPLHKDLQYSGLLNPLDAPHHLRQQNEFLFREGVITNKQAKNGKGSFVNIGLLNDAYVEDNLTPGLRVTVKLEQSQYSKMKKVRGTIVPPTQPRLETGVYWGYNVRIANSISQVLTQSPYENGYDLTIGTSDRGKNVHEIEDEQLNYNHAIIIFGGLQGIEAALENDDKLNVDDPNLVFDQYLNTIPGQGSRTIRTEEAILISLACIERKWKADEKAKKFILSQAIPQSGDTGLPQAGIPKKIAKKREMQKKNQQRPKF